MRRVDQHKLRFLYRPCHATTGQLALALALGGTAFGGTFGFLGLVSHFLMGHLEPVLPPDKFDRPVDQRDQREASGQHHNQVQPGLPRSA